MKKTRGKPTSLLFLLTIIFTISTQVFAELPPLLPKVSFFAGDINTSAKISPNGKYIAYLAHSDKKVMNVWVKSRDKDDDRLVTQEDKRNIHDFDWTYDNRYVIYLKDSGGDENFHLFATHIETGVGKDLTPFKGVKAQNILLNKNHPNEILIGLNKRDKRHHDMYRIDLKSGKVKQETENPGDVRWWLADSNFVIRAAVAYSPKDVSTIIRIRDGEDKPWRDLISWPFGETGLLEGYGKETAIAFTPDGKALYVQSAFEGNYTQLAKVDTQTGKVLEIVAKHPHASIWNILGITLYDEAQILFHPDTMKVQAVGFNYLIPEWKILDPKLKEDFKVLKQYEKGVFEVFSRDLENRWWTIKYYSDESTGGFYLYNRETKKATLIFEVAPHLKKFSLASMKPVVIKARDGMEIPCYLTLPVGVEAKNLPMVLFIHGGPWARDEWGFDEFVQIFANRGYAVLKVNFRGSAGLGKKFLNAGNGQWGTGYMQHDITDAVKHFIKEGIADPKRIAIVGGSYGGYATLAGLTFTPDLYTCGISICGPANMRTNVESMPDWWFIIKKRWLRRMGNVLEDEEMNRRISPYFHADQIKAKLLIFHGVNDPRVKIEESNRIVNAMRKNKKEVTYVVYPDEGHGIGRSQNLLDMLSRIEAFLAKHLGGRAEPWQDVPGSSAQLR